MATFANAYVKGLLNEQRIKPHCEKLWGVCQKLAPKHTFDFDGGSFFVEVKSRFCNFLDYETTLLPYHKIAEMEYHPDKELYCVFVFYDGAYYIKYDEATFKTFFVEQNFVCKKRKDKDDKPAPHYHIPICKLTKIPTFNGTASSLP